jgi:ABC-type multidrug transport system ATPase subunit
VTRQPARCAANWGYIPQDFGFFKSLNAFETLDYIGTMKNLPQPQRRQQVDSLLEQVNLTGTPAAAWAAIPAG